MTVLLYYYLFIIHLTKAILFSRLKNGALVSKHVTHPGGGVGGEENGYTKLEHFEDRFLHCTFLRLESKGIMHTVTEFCQLNLS